LPDCHERAVGGLEHLGVDGRERAVPLGQLGGAGERRGLGILGGDSGESLAAVALDLAEPEDLPGGE